VTYLLMAFLIILVTPLLIGTWRVSLLGLAAQGFVLSWMMLEHGFKDDFTFVVQLLDVVVVRTLVAPRMLHGILRSRNMPARNDVIPPNLLSWALAGVLLLFAFRFAQRFHPQDVAASTHLAVATATVLLGFLVLASGNSLFSQMVGFLRVENGIFLFELSSTHHMPPLVQLAVSGVYLGTVLLFGYFLRHQPQVTTGAQEVAP